MGNDGAAPSSGSHLAFPDALKAAASQLIVLHHLAFYGPMSDAAAPLAPGLVGWFSDHARIAVQAFLVTGGFLAVRGLAPDGVLRAEQPLRLVARRYMRLVVPFAAALALAVVLAGVARTGMVHPSIPAAPDFRQMTAHLLLLHDLLDYEALTAGAWYVAIDLQLFALMVVLLWIARASACGARAQVGVGVGLVAVVALASLFHFNRDAWWDESALYFFGAYAMGAFAWWLARHRDAPAWLAGLAVLATAALLVEFRSRIAVALCVALALAASLRGGWAAHWPGSPAVAWLGRIGYSVFLVHFPVIIVVGAAFHRFAGGDPWLNAVGIGTAWAASVVVGALFHRFVERPAMGRGP